MVATSTLSRHLVSISRSKNQIGSKLSIHASSVNYFGTPPSSNRKLSSTSVQVPPPPSWSISELRLISSGDEYDKISEEELAILARRCLIDIRRLTPHRREQLRIDVGGVMRCASVLVHVKNLNDTQDCSGDREKYLLTDADVYDRVRGLTKIPIRRDVLVAADKRSDASCWEQGEESRAVLAGETVEGKMVEFGGEKYFSVVTKRE